MTRMGFWQTGFAIHRYHKHGHLEKVYENALAHRLQKLGLDVKQQYPLKVYDEDGTLIGDYHADLFVDTRAGSLPNCGHFTRELAVSRRTLMRDLDFLRDDHHAPIAYDDSRKGFKLTDPTFKLAPVELTRWILSWIPHVKVLAPGQLRDRVRQRMRQGLAHCG
jgi:hypothetical protein